MAQGYNRRDFIRNAALYGLSVNLIPTAGMVLHDSGGSKWVINNDYFTIAFDEKNGRIGISRSNGDILLSGGVPRINLKEGKRAASDPGFSHSATVKRISDTTGQGRLLEIFSSDGEKKTDLTLACRVYDKLSCVFLSLKCRNVSARAINIHSLEPVCATSESGGFLQWSPAVKALTNGPMYYDPGMVIDLNDQYTEPAPYGPVKGGYLSPDFKYPSGERIRSWWNIALFGGYDREGLVCGFTENKTGLGQLVLSGNNGGIFSLYTESVFAPGTMLEPGREISSGDFVIMTGSNPYAALEGYASLMGRGNNALAGNPVNGWCSWFYTYEHVTEEEVIRNSEFIAKNLRPYGLDVVQVDEGYQRFHGEWEGNERFPHGMKWLAEKIRDYGLKPGIWVAPYVVSEPAALFGEHPEWLLKHPDGRLMRVGPWPDENSDWARNENPKRYGLDITHPGAQKWMSDLFNKMSFDWGYEMFKIDFVAWSLLSAHGYYDTGYTPASAYRKGMEIIRRAIGPQKHINDCGPGPVSAGLIDSMRIESDQNYGFAEAAWKQYFLESSSSAPAAAKRYYFHSRAWINDADHLCMSLLNIQQSRAAATLIGLTGGNLISGDRLSELDPVKVEILRKVTPSSGIAAKPVDLFDTDRHTIFAAEVRNKFSNWTIAGFFNPDMNEPARRTLPLERLWLDPSATYIAYDFWNGRLHGEISREIVVTIPAADVTLLAIHKKPDRPEIISADRHIMQGLNEFDDISWDDATRTLHVVSAGIPHSQYNVMVWVPEGITWQQGKSVLYRDYDNYSVRPADRQLIKVHLRFGEGRTIKWNLSFA